MVKESGSVLASTPGGGKCLALSQGRAKSGCPWCHRHAVTLRRKHGTTPSNLFNGIVISVRHGYLVARCLSMCRCRDEWTSLQSFTISILVFLSIVLLSSGPKSGLRYEFESLLDGYSYPLTDRGLVATYVWRTSVSSGATQLSG